MGLLVVEPTRALRERLVATAGEAGVFEPVVAVSSAEEALGVLARTPLRLALVDADMDGGAGISLAALVRQGWPGCAVVVLAAVPEPELRARCAAADVREVVAKASADSLLAVLRAVARDLVPR